MKSIIAIGLLLFASICQASSYRATVTEVVDGDTIKVKMLGKEQAIELAHIDCPELSQSYGSQAAEYVRDKIANKEVGIETKGTNVSRETLAEVVLLQGGKNLNYLLVKEGLAWPAKKNKSKPIAKLAAQAQAAKSGLWQQANPIPPWKVAPKKKHAILKFARAIAAGSTQAETEEDSSDSLILSSAYTIDASARQLENKVLFTGRVSGPECDRIRIRVSGVSNQGDWASVYDVVSISKGVKSTTFEGEDTNYIWDKSRAKPQWEISRTHASCD